MRRALATDAGQAIVEVAFVLPLVLLLMLAAIDFGVAYQRYLELTSAARSAVRYGSLYPLNTDSTQSADPANMKYQVKREANSVPLGDPNIAIYYEVYGTSPPPSYDASVGGNSVYAVSGNFVRVTITYAYVPFTPYLRVLVPNGSFTITSTALMQIE